jgi:glutathione S-transferase
MAILLGASLSSFVRKVLIFSFEAGIELEHRNDIVPFPASAELLAVNPRGKIPGYSDNDIKLGESSVICAYLDRKHGGTGLYPTKATDYGRALWFEKYAEEELTSAIVKVFFNRVLIKMIGGTPDENAIKEALTVDQPRVFTYLNEQIGNKEFLVGDQFSIADISTFSPYVNHKIAGEEVDATLYPNLHRYLQRLKTRPSVQRAVEMDSVKL